MHRHQVVNVCSIVLTLATCPIAVAAPPGFQSDKIEIFDGVLNDPAYGGGKKVIGTQITFRTGNLGRERYYIAAVAEIKRKGGNWVEIPCRRNYRRYYGYTTSNNRVIARDIHRAKQGELVSLFVPDEVLSLRKGGGEYRIKLVFVDDDDRTLQEARLPAVPVSIEIRQGGQPYFYRARREEATSLSRSAFASRIQVRNHN